MPAFRFSDALLKWHDRHGRQDLPWQQEITPYRVWVSEIMLQQTQVTTVIPYYLKFIASFPDVSSLAYARLDRVLAHWTGLGYYARARHLHKAAQEICTSHGGELPDNLAALQALPGIGRSTAGAILAIGYGKRAAILDGNVKRVLARFHAIPGWPGDKKVEKSLWEWAEEHTPTRRVGTYTQAIMDLGALVCTPTRPACGECPLKRHCQAFSQDATELYPGKKNRQVLPVRHTCMLVIRNKRGEFLLYQRPATGLWGGLWGCPETGPDTDPAHAVTQLLPACRLAASRALPAWRHSFSHYHLEIRPVLLDLAGRLPAPSRHRWVTAEEARAGLGLAAPTLRLLAEASAC